MLAEAVGQEPGQRREKQERDRIKRGRKTGKLLQLSTLSCPDIVDKDVSGLGESVEDIPALFASG